MGTAGIHSWGLFSLRARFTRTIGRARALALPLEGWTRRSALLSLWVLGLIVAYLLLASELLEFLILAVLAASVAFILHQMTNPTPLFWAAPWEAWQLLSSRRARVNHAWLHHTEELLRQHARGSRTDGTTSSEGFLIMTPGTSVEEVRWWSELSWGELQEEFLPCESARGCKAFRLLLSFWFAIGGLLALGTFGRLEWPAALICMAICAAIGHALAPRLESHVLAFAALAAWRKEKTGPDRIEIGEIELPRFLWFGGGKAFLVSRGRLGLMEEIRADERALQVVIPGR